MTAELLDLPHLSLISRSDDSELRRIETTVVSSRLIAGRAELEEMLCELLAHGRCGAPKTLDLIGHSTVGTSLLSVGDWVLDATNATVTAFFRELADHAVLDRLGIHSLRLLGCSTAASAHGIWTICALADILGVEVHGTTGPVLASHYDAHGFEHASRHLLISATELRRRETVARPHAHAVARGYVLDIDMLPPAPLDGHRPWPVHVVSAEQARELLSLVRRHEGAVLPNLVESPCCELALPSPIALHYHRIEVLLDGEVIRVHTPGAPHGITYPVADADAFRQLVTYAARG